MFIKLTSFVVFLCLQLTACGSSSSATQLPYATISAKDSPTVQKLYKQYNDWRGVRYRNGGMSKQGVDCSGFVYLTYNQKIGKKIARTTELQLKQGSSINKQQLKPGDLVFFKTGWKQRHVGIYIEKGKFMHASSSRGVMISRLDNPYWSDAYWHARRIN